MDPEAGVIMADKALAAVLALAKREGVKVGWKISTPSCLQYRGQPNFLPNNDEINQTKPNQITPFITIMIAIFSQPMRDRDTFALKKMFEHPPLVKKAS